MNQKFNQSVKTTKRQRIPIARNFLLLLLLVTVIVWQQLTIYSLRTANANHVMESLSSSSTPLSPSSSLIPDSCSPAHIPTKFKQMFGKTEMESESTYAYTPFHEYFAKMMIQDKCEECPLAHKWVPYFEAYHDQFKRFRNKKVTLLEIGVQSGGSIAMWREYFGKQLHYIGVDINPETKRFDDADWIDIHIGDTGDPKILETIRNLYPDGVDILLDDGGHTMSQQINTFQNLMDFVKPDGILVCEDLATSWSQTFGGVPNAGIGSATFRDTTMVGRIHHAIDWLHAGFIAGSKSGIIVAHTAEERPQNLYPQFPEYRTFLHNFKSIHIFNQIVFFHRGTYEQVNLKTKGTSIPYKGMKYSGYKLPWKKVENAISDILSEEKLSC